MNTLSYTIDSMNTHVEQATIEQYFYKAECVKSRNDIERIHNLRCIFLLEAQYSEQKSHNQ